MKYFYPISILFLFISIPSLVFSQPNTKVEYIPEFENSNYPQIAYWFLTPEILENGKYIPFLKNMINKSPFDFIFLDARNGPSFGNVEKMHPVLEQIVKQTHKRNIKIGYRAQVQTPNPLPEDSTERFVEKQNNIYQITIADQTKTNQLLINKLN